MDTITVLCQVRRADSDTTGPRAWINRSITLPSWCSGDPAMAVALYVFGHRDFVADVHVMEVI